VSLRNNKTPLNNNSLQVLTKSINRSEPDFNVIRKHVLPTAAEISHEELELNYSLHNTNMFNGNDWSTEHVKHNGKFMLE